MRKLHALTIVIILALIPLTLGCPVPEQGRGPGDDGVVNGEPDQPGPYQAAETLAKRVALYRLALQEGDLAPFTARSEALEGVQVPDAARMINRGWWDVDLETAHIAPLHSTKITALEPEVFPLVATRLEESDDEQGWCLFTLGYDPDAIRLIIADAHEEWIPEKREWFLEGMEDGCVQVWCVRIAGEWKIVANLPCSSRIDPPTPPTPPTLPPATERSPIEPEEPEEAIGDAETITETEEE